MHALLGPWKVFAMGVRQGSLSLADLPEMWDESKGTTGPVANAKAGLARAGIEGGIDCWTAGDSQLRDPLGDLQLGDRKWVDFLLKAYEVKQLQKLAQRRPVYQGLREGHDIQSQRRAIAKAGLSTRQQGALRGVQLGNLATQDRCRHWADRPGCTCGAPKETPYHRFFVCADWDEVRQEALGGTNLREVLEELPEVTLHTGLAVMDPEVRDARARAEKPAEVVDPFQGKVLPAVVFTDGSAIHPAD